MICPPTEENDDGCKCLLLTFVRFDQIEEMFENENEIRCLVDDLLDRVSLINSSDEFIRPIDDYWKNKSIEEKFSSSFQHFHRSMKKLFQLELEILVHNGSLNLTTLSNRSSRSSHPTTTTIKQTNDLKKKLRWINLRKTFLQQIDSNKSDEPIQSISNLDQCENLWFEHRLNMLNNSIDVFRQNRTNFNDENEEIVSSREEIYRRKNFFLRPLRKTIEEKFRRTNSNRSNFSFSFTSDLINNCAKLADRIGLTTTSISNSNSSKKLSSTIQKKKSTLMKIPSSIGGENHRKRSFEECRTTISNNFDLNSKRQKRIASPSSSSSNVHQSNEIITPTWRILNSIDFDFSTTNSNEENEDISDEIYLRRHIRCEFEQETWIQSSQNRKCLQTSISLPSGLSTTTTTTNKC